uniref:U31-Liphistoxin-Lth1a_1 n=1 Tax=Liphistius thaleban TaxID=1905330 RepID=A0A4Q8K2M2_9ARAC
MYAVAYVGILMLWILQKNCILSENVCGPPPVVENGVITNDEGNYEIGVILTYSCDFGFVSRNNRRTAECVEENGVPEWRKPDILCIPKSCGDPGSVDHGQRKGHVFTFPNKVEYVCDEGYRLIGRSTRYCQTSGEWSDRLPSCRVVQCSTPNHPAKGRVIYSSVGYGSQLRYECNEGFRLNHKETRVCNSNGEWSGEEPFCEEVTCDEPESPANGKVEVIGDRNAGSIALYTCDPGTKLVGSASSKCLDNGRWLFDAPKCTRPCRTPYVQNGRFGKHETSRYRNSFRRIDEGNVVDDGLEFVWKCDQSYEATDNGESESKVVCENGEWSKQIQCNPARCRRPPPVMQNAFIESIDESHGGTVIYKCNHFFKVLRESRVVCHFGRWTGSTGSCKDTRCDSNRLNQISGLVSNHEQRYMPSGYSFQPQCDGNYQLSETNSGMISCDEGEWKGNLSPCVPASCIHPAPEPEHGKSQPYEKSHGSTVVYDCDEGYLKAVYGSVKCQYGVWTGNPPSCERSSHCRVPNVPNGSVGKYGRTRQSYNDFQHAGFNTYVNPGEEYILKCIEGFEAASQRKGETNIKCENGGWSLQIQCTPAKPCTDPPPVPMNGKVQTVVNKHDGYVWYSCDRTHIKAKAGNITCKYGEWQGIVPVCKDRRCYLKDLTQKEGVRETNSATQSGRQAELVCEEGYSLAYSPKCSDGDWELQGDNSPCQPSPCEIHDMENGRIQQLKVKNRINLGPIKFWKKEYLERAEIGSRIAHGQEMFVSCDSPYIFGGKDSSETVSIHCEKGRWKPNPECLIRNRNNEDDIERDEIASEEENNPFSNVDSNATEIILLPDIDELKPSQGNDSDRNSSITGKGKIPVIEDATVAPTSAVESTSSIVKNISVDRNENDHIEPSEAESDACTCTYEVNDFTLNAYVGDKLLQYGDQVKNGDTVKFRCRNIGYYRFHGSKEAHCRECNWNLSKFPECKEPNDNDAMISLPEEDHNRITIQPDGVVVVRTGTRIAFVCSTYYLHVCPEWKVRTASRTKFKSDCISTTYGVRYALSVWYEIFSAKESDSGKYECKVSQGKVHYIQVVVRDLLCPEIKEDNSVVVTYSNHRKLFSTASFTCSHPDWQLNGRNRIRCQENGQWSGEPPICKYVECSLIPESDGMTIEYRPNRLVFGRAVFHCSASLKRRGPVSVSCQASGTWSDTIPSCSKPMCPEIPESDSVIITYNGDRNIQSTASFRCANPEFILIGPEIIYCLATEKWNQEPPKCKYVTCNVEAIFESLPEGVVPKVENLETGVLPVGYELDLQCDSENRHVVGKDKVSCEPTGLWSVGAVKCELGCGPLKKKADSNLIISPEKETYKFGDSVELSCPKNEVLTKDVFRIVCLSNGWSEDDIPDCKAAKS